MQANIWFKECKTVAEVKQEYKRLAFANHPDKGGDTRTMQDINAAYLVYLAKMNGQVNRGSDGKDHTYHYNEHVEKASMDVIDRLIKAGFTGAVTIELLGTWVWVDGIVKGSGDDTIRQSLPHPTYIKKDGKPGQLLKWHAKRGLYYWAPEGSRSKYNKHASFNDLRYTYGSQTFKSEQEESKPKRQPAMAFGD